MESRLGLTQVSVFSAGTLLGFILGVNLPIEVCWQKHCFHPVKTWMWHFKNPPRKTLWVLILPSLWSIFCRYQKTILKKHLTRSWSHRTPRFIMACLVTQLNIQRTISSPHFHHRKVVWLKCVFSVLRDCKETWWVWTWQLGSTSQNCSHPVKARICHSQIHLRKSFQCLNKHFHYHQFWSLVHDFSEETLCMDLFTRTSSHRTPRFIEYSSAMPLMTHRSARSHYFLRGNVLVSSE